MGTRIEQVIGQRLREMREARDWSGEQLGLRLGELLTKPWSRQAVSQAENGQRSFTAAEIFAIAVVFDCDIANLFRLPLDTVEVTMPSGVELKADRLLGRRGARPNAASTRRSLREITEAAKVVLQTGKDVERLARGLSDTVG